MNIRLVDRNGNTVKVFECKPEHLDVGVFLVGSRAFVFKHMTRLEQPAVFEERDAIHISLE